MQRVTSAAFEALHAQKPASTRFLLGSADSTSATKGLSPALGHILQEVQRELGYELRDRAVSAIEDRSDAGAVVTRVAERLGFQLSSYERDEVLAYVERDDRPFGLLQSLIDDRSITDIIITDFSKITVQQGRRNFSTDLSFPNQAVYESFVERLLLRAGATYSTKKPIADGMIGSFARLHAVHRSLCDTGPYVTIRINRFSSVELQDLLRFGLAPSGVLDYLRAIVEIGRTVLIVGEVGTGKTTLVRALASGLPGEEAILVIEDTPEIRLEHPHVRYITTREANSDGAGRVTPAECIRAGMRMAMNRIIFGEIRDAEAAESFVDVCASGHPGISTMHGRNSLDALARLELFLGRAQKGVQRLVLSEQIATAVHVIAHVDICKETGRRRIMDVREIGPVADGVLRQREMFKYVLSAGLPTWKVSNKISSHRDGLEKRQHPVSLSTYPSVLELAPEVLLHENLREHRD